MPFVPKKGQWVQFSLPDDVAKVAEERGAWKTTLNLFCGIMAGDSRTVEGITLLPPRIMLVDEKGHNVRGILNWTVKDLWVFADTDNLTLLQNVETEEPHDVHVSPEEKVALFKEQGCIGTAEQLRPVDHREDCPPGRRPDIHPKLLRKSIPIPFGHSPTATQAVIGEATGNLLDQIRKGLAEGKTFEQVEAEYRDQQEKANNPPKITTE